MKDEELRKLYTLYTIEAFLDYGDLPQNFREGWSPSFGLHFEEMGIGEDEKAHAYISMAGKLKKSKCELIEDKNLAEKFLNHVEPRLKKLYPSITINLRNVKSSELDYRRKKALDEAKSNTLQILNLVENIQKN